MKPEDNEEEESREDTADFIISSNPPHEQNGVSLRAATLEKLVEFCAREFGKCVSFDARFLRCAAMSIQETKKNNKIRLMFVVAVKLPSMSVIRLLFLFGKSGCFSAL